MFIKHVYFRYKNITKLNLLTLSIFASGVPTLQIFHAMHGGQENYFSRVINTSHNKKIKYCMAFWQYKKASISSIICVLFHYKSKQIGRMHQICNF